MSQELVLRAEGFIHACTRYENRLVTLQEELVKNQKRMDKLEHDKEVVVKAKKVLDLVSQTVAEKGIGKIETIVTGGMRIVFGKNYRFVIEKKAGARGTTYRLLVEKDGVLGEPMDTNGGGIVNIVSLLLRVIMIKRWKRASFLALDEALNGVAVKYIPKASEMLRSLASDHHFNIIAVTHQEALAKSADMAYRVEPGTETTVRIVPVDPTTITISTPAEDTNG